MNPKPPSREPEPSYGPDEEGDVIPPENDPGDRAAWVHERPEETDRS